MKEKIWRNFFWFAQKICWSPRCVAHRGDNFVIEYLDEIVTEFENNLACLSGAQMGSNHEKNRRSKISWHTPFKKQNYSNFYEKRATEGKTIWHARDYIVSETIMKPIFVLFLY